MEVDLEEFHRGATFEQMIEVQRTVTMKAKATQCPKLFEHANDLFVLGEEMFGTRWLEDERIVTKA